MRHSRLKNKANKSKSPTDAQSCKKLNLITKLKTLLKKNILLTLKIQLTLTTPETNVSRIFQTSTITVSLKLC